MYMLKISIPRKHLVSYSANVDVLYIAISETIGRWHEASGLLLLRELANHSEEVFYGLWRGLHVHNKSRATERDWVGELACPLYDLGVGHTDGGRVKEHLT